MLNFKPTDRQKINRSWNSDRQQLNFKQDKLEAGGMLLLDIFNLLQISN